MRTEKADEAGGGEEGGEGGEGGRGEDGKEGGEGRGGKHISESVMVGVSLAPLCTFEIFGDLTSGIPLRILQIVASFEATAQKMEEEEEKLGELGKKPEM